MKDQIHSRHYLKQRREGLRNNLTPAEAQLWNVLKKAQLHGRKFRRQHSIENYIVDFYCAEEKLIIELDGNVHYKNGAAYTDAEREDRLEELGFTIVRFENYLIFRNLDGVLEEITSHFNRYPRQK